MTWLETHRPQSVSECIGIRSEFNAIKQFFQSWKEERPIGSLLILGGIAGTGKTTLVHAIANDLEMELMEVNASDTRNVDSLGAAVAQAYQSTFDNSKRILLLDEADGIKAWGPIERVIASPPCAVVLTANTTTKIPFAIRKQALQFALEPPSLRHRRRLIDFICEEEGLEHDGHTRNLIAQACTTWRSVVVTLQTTPVGVEEAELHERLHDMSNTDSLIRLLTGREYTGQPQGESIVRYAIYNGGDGDDIAKALLLMAHSRKVTGLHQVAQAYTRALRCADPVETPPFRKRKSPTEPSATHTASKPTTPKTTSPTPTPSVDGFGGFFS